VRLSSPLRAVLFAPYLALLYPLIALRRASFALRPGHAWRTWITPNLLLGGFLLPGDVRALAELDVRAVINVTHELIDPRAALADAGIAYLRVPCWDACAPSLEHAERGVRMIAAEIAAGRRVYVHCASGAGRSVALVLCYLAAHEDVTVDEALGRIKSLRPSIAMRPAQRAFVDRFVASRRGSPTEP
jgi:protein-tyrosine phosphatase